MSNLLLIKTIFTFNIIYNIINPTQWGDMMAFYPSEYLEQGKTDFLFNLNKGDHEVIISYIRHSEKKNDIIKKFLPKIKNELPEFCFNIIYDNNEFINEAKELFNKLYTIDNIPKELLKKIITKSKLGDLLLKENFTKIINKFDDLDFLFFKLFSNFDNNFNTLKKLSISKNLHIRFKFMKYLLINHCNKITFFYDDITKYFTAYTYKKNEQLAFYNEVMDSNELSQLALVTLENNLDYNLYLKIKDFIFNNFETNSLLKYLLKDKEKRIDNNSYKLIQNEIGINEFKKDADNYFDKANSGRLTILNKYEEYISTELLENFKYYLSFFYHKNKLDNNYFQIDQKGLGKTLEIYIDKYLSISENKTHNYISRGTTASCFRIGDYVFKLISRKWSYEKIICPKLYLILPNLEENLVRNTDGTVLAGIEIQKYLQKDVKNVPKDVFDQYEKELLKLGYYTTDSLRGGIAGDNTKLLDDYKESGNPNPPDWFKEYPIVLIDHDRVYKKENKNPKQLHCRVS